MRAYFDLLDSNIKINGGPSINLSEYADNFCLFKLNLGYYHTEARDHVEAPKLQNCRLTLNFAANSNNPSLSLIVYEEKNGVVSINANREVTLNYVI